MRWRRRSRGENASARGRGDATLRRGDSSLPDQPLIADDGLRRSDHGRPPPPRDMQSLTIPAALFAAAIAIGAAAGVGGFTFVYAEGASYLTDDPAACANCHV